VGVDVARRKVAPSGRVFPQPGQTRAARVRLVISDARGAQTGDRDRADGAAWQRCRVHFICEPAGDRPMAAREPIAAVSGHLRAT